MRAIQIEQPGRDAALRLVDRPSPECGPDDLRLRVRAAGVNRGDLLQRRGLYPPPPGVTDVPGLECSGEVVEVGADVAGWRVGERAMALLAGGGYAEEVVVHAGSVLRFPERWSWVEAAAVPEVFQTVHLCLFRLAGLRAGETVLVQGGSGGIGTAAIQLARHVGARVLVTAGTAERRARCVALGAQAALDHAAPDLLERVLAATGGGGVDVVLDHVGASALAVHLRALRTGGRLVSIGLLGGARTEIDLAQVLTKRLTLFGSTLRARSAREKAELVDDFVQRFGAALAGGSLHPVVDRAVPQAEADEAHRALAAGEVFGKIVLEVR